MPDLVTERSTARVAALRAERVRGYAGGGKGRLRYWMQMSPNGQQSGHRELSEGSQMPLRLQPRQLPQSLLQVAHVSLPEQIPSPQVLPQLPQSRLQFEHDSPVSQTPLPQTVKLHGPQSLRHNRHDSPEEQTPSPQGGGVDLHFPDRKMARISF